MATAPRKNNGCKPGTAHLTRMRLANGLTPQQEAFCRGRAMGMSSEEAMAASEIGYSLQTVRNWERYNQAIRSRIEELSAIATKNAVLSTGLDREWVISRLMSVVNRCMEAEPVLDKNGAATGTFEFNAAGANQALRMLGDTLGMFKPAETQPGDEYANLSDDDLYRISAELAAETGLIEFAQGAKAAPGPEQVIEVQAVRQAKGIS